MGRIRGGGKYDAVDRVSGSIKKVRWGFVKKVTNPSRRVPEGGKLFVGKPLYSGHGLPGGIRRAGAGDPAFPFGRVVVESARGPVTV